MTNDNELQEMREQLALLKTQLDKEVRLREDALKKTLSHGAGSMKVREVVGMVFTSIVAVIVPLVMYFTQGISLWLSLFTFVSMLAMVVWQGYKNYYLLNVGDLLEDDLVTAQSNLQQYKREAHKQLFYFGLPWVAVFFVWYLAETYMKHMPVFAGESMSYHVGFLIGMGASMAVGGVIGGLIGYFTFYRPQMKMADKMMAEIDELTKG